MKGTIIGKRVKCVKTGEQGTVTGVIGCCLNVRMDDGQNLSGGRPRWKLIKQKESFAKAGDSNPV